MNPSDPSDNLSYVHLLSPDVQAKLREKHQEIQRNHDYEVRIYEALRDGEVSLAWLESLEWWCLEADAALVGMVRAGKIVESHCMWFQNGEPCLAKEYRLP